MSLLSFPHVVFFNAYKNVFSSQKLGDYVHTHVVPLEQASISCVG